ncbi:galectin-6 isoform X3 [Octopus bimaculoides]|uniref:Galectin n=2 Tax=Octopus bimaculoides TaxID=37653 RepID=A0A0L8I276_OCTBM|nr:galectin-6 isoform X3 [Octopus bimaculoides]
MSYSHTDFPTPSVHHITGGVRAGKQFIFSGFAQDGCDGFHINFTTDYDGSSIAFHFNPRIGDATVVCNSYDEGWGDEVRETENFPFFERQRFTLCIVADEDAFKVYVNGTHFLNFYHRMSYENVNYLAIGDGVELYEMIMRDSLRIPYIGEIADRMSIGKAIEIKGVPTFDHDSGTDAVRFSINICSDPNGTTGLHLNPRPDQNSVVLNHYDGDWGEEEVISDNPFHPWSMFKLMIVASYDGYQIFLNDNYFALFPYRCSIDSMKYLYIHGCISIASINYLRPLPMDFTKEIPSGLQYKDIIKVTGFFTTGDRFAVNLKHGNEIPLHLNPRRDEGEMVLNSYTDEEWGEEERHPLPVGLLEGIPFEMKIRVKEDKLKVYINEKSFASFHARKPVESINNISYNGEVYIYNMQLLRRVDVPHVERLPGTLAVDRWIKIGGSVRKHAERFAINLKCDDDILLHLNPRLNEEQVVLNHYCGGEWGEEERTSDYFPFMGSEPFELLIACQEESFKIYVNGNYLTDFAHRMPFECAKTLELSEDAHFFHPEIY